MKFVKLFSLSAVVVATLLTSCEKLKDFGDTNVNPNATTKPNTAALLSNVLAGVSARASQQNPGYYCQYFAETQYPGVSLYSLPQFDFDGIYAGAMYDCQNIIKTCGEDAATASANGSVQNQIAIATVLKCYYFWTITDAWGDIPYSQALTINNIFPKYDTQEDVYKGVIAELTNVVDNFDATGVTVKGDLAFSGDVTKWKKLANSIRLLMSLRLSKKYPEAGQYAAQQFNLALSHPAGVIEANTDNFKITYPGGNFMNPWYSLYNGRDDVGESLFFVQLLNSLQDRRQVDRAYGSSDNGVPYGRNRELFMNNWFSSNSTTYSKVLGANFRTSSSAVALVHAASVWLARAEAKQRQWTTEADDVPTMYTKGIAASYTQWGISASNVATYLTNPSVELGVDNLNKIALQRYIASYPDGLQGWCEWRRTGIPELTEAQDAVNSSKAIPRRFVYGNNDYSTNRQNVLAAAAAIPLPVPTPTGSVAGDTQDGRVWWDR